jgi:hypothetical protein
MPSVYYIANKIATTQCSNCLHSREWTKFYGYCMVWKEIIFPSPINQTSYSECPKFKPVISEPSLGSDFDCE